MSDNCLKYYLESQELFYAENLKPRRDTEKHACAHCAAFMYHLQAASVEFPAVLTLKSDNLM